MTTTHIYDELPRMLTGEANREDVLSAADHLRTCVDCQQELVSAVVAHASLTSARRFAPEIISRMFDGNFAEQESTETAEVSRLDDADADADANADADADADDERPQNAMVAAGLPGLSAVFARVRKEAAEPHRTTRPSRLSQQSRFRYVAGAGVAAAAAAVFITVGVVHSDNKTTPGQIASRALKLAAYDKGTTTATAKINGGEMTIDAASLPAVSGKRYEVWLTDTARTKMQPVGWLGPNGKAAITVPTDLMSQYQDVEVSVQDVASNDYAYSGTSVLRGSID